VLALTIVSTLLPSRARAQVALAWRRLSGAEACPDAAALRTAVTARVGSGFVLADEGATRVLEGEVAPLWPGHRVHIRLRERSGALLGERTLVDRAADCAALSEATALAIALLFESAPPPTPSPASPPPPFSARAPEGALRPPAPAGAVAEQPAVGPPRPAPGSRWRYALAAGALGSLALLPSPTVHAFVGLRVAPTPLYAIELRLVALGGADQQVGGDSLGSARFSTIHALLAGCRQLLRTRWLGLDACVGLIAGVVRAEGSGFSEQDFTSSAPLVAGSARLASELTLVGPLYSALALGLGVPFTNTRFVALDTNGQPRELMDTRPVFGTLELGVGARF